MQKQNDIILLEYFPIRYEKNKNKNCKICFHSREIRMKQNAFNMLHEKYEDFLKDLSNVIQKVNFEIIPVHIDLKKLIEEKIEEEVYEYAFDKLISEFDRRNI